MRDSGDYVLHHELCRQLRRAKQAGWSLSGTQLAPGSGVRDSGERMEKSRERPTALQDTGSLDMDAGADHSLLALANHFTVSLA